MRILFYGINFAPEKIGAGKFSSEMCEYFSDNGASVLAIVGEPHYPEWKRYNKSKFKYWDIKKNLKIIRIPLYIPKKPFFYKRIIHYILFFMLSAPILIFSMFLFRPSILLAISPTIIAAALMPILSKITGAVSWLHVQDLEIRAAIAVQGMNNRASIMIKLAKFIEKTVISSFDITSSISDDLCKKLSEISRRDVHMFRNWADLKEIYPSSPDYNLIRELECHGKKIVLYSGNIGYKQGIDIIIKSARITSHRNDILYLVSGDGVYKDEFIEMSRDLKNIYVSGLQPRENLNKLLNLASIHLLPQQEGLDDAVFPSKLSNMLASGKPIIASCSKQSAVARFLGGVGIVVPVGDEHALALAIVELVDNPILMSKLGQRSRSLAESALNADDILSDFMDELVCASR